MTAKGCMKNPKKPMLARDADWDTIKYPVFVSKKLDGVRATVQNGVVLSRSLKPIPNKYVQEIFGVFEGCDGELIVGNEDAEDVFSKTTSGVMSVDGQPDVTFWVFDRIDLADRTYNTRRQGAEVRCEALRSSTSNVRVLPVHSVGSEEELRSELLRASEGHWEGLILRHPDRFYKHGRATKSKQELLRIKFFEDDEFVIKGFVEQYENTNEQTTNELGYSSRSSSKAGKKPKGTLGKIIVGNDKWPEDFSVGTGFNDALRKEIWDNQENYLGKIVKVRYQAVGCKDKPRIPSFKGFRDKRDMS